MVFSPQNRAERIERQYPGRGSNKQVFTASKPLIWFLQPLIATTVSVGVELSVDHETGHANMLADGLSRAKPAMLAQCGPANPVVVDIPQLLRRGRQWTLYPQDVRWPDHLLASQNQWNDIKMSIGVELDGRL